MHASFSGFNLIYTSEQKVNSTQLSLVCELIDCSAELAAGYDFLTFDEQRH